MLDHDKNVKHYRELVSRKICSGGKPEERRAKVKAGTIRINCLFVPLNNYWPSSRVCLRPIWKHLPSKDGLCEVLNSMFWTSLCKSMPCMSLGFSPKLACASRWATTFKSHPAALCWWKTQRQNIRMFPAASLELQPGIPTNRAPRSVLLLLSMNVGQ